MNSKYNVPCPTCGEIKNYVSERNMFLLQSKNCRSCANSIGRGGNGNVKPKDGKKRCIDCDIYKTLDQFNKTKTGKIYSACVECSKIRSVKYHTSHYKYSKYGLTKELYDEMYESQNFRCKICMVETKLVVDHDHKTGHVRGLLCRECNSAIGLLKENFEIIKNVIKYLKEN